ncbi:ribosomal protein L16 [Tanacetum coccineum]
MEDPQCSSHSLNSINAIKLCSKQTNEAQKDQTQVKTLTVNENRTHPSKEIKSPSKLLSPKYQSQSSLGEQNRSSSSSSLKCIYFVNTITVIRKDDEFREACTIESDAAEGIGHDTIVEGEKETEEGLDSSKPVTEENESRDIKRKDLNDSTCRETKEGLEVFVGNFTYECDFVIVEDITSVIDHYLGGMVLGKPFVKETGLVYNKEEGTLMFKKGRSEGAEIARTECKKYGKTSSNVFNQKIDYAPTEVSTRYGISDLPITGKPTEVRMGRGKGNPAGWIARVSTGQIPFEMDGVSLSNARQAATLAAHKLCASTKFVQWS